MQLIWYGTASVCIRTETAELITDPFIPLPGSRVPIQAEDFAGHDTVLITHGHIDHIGSLPILCKLERRKILCSRTPGEQLRALGVPAGDIQVIRAGESLMIRGEKKRSAEGNEPPSVSVTAVSAVCPEAEASLKEKGNISVTVYPGRHIRFDLPLVLKTLFSPRMITYAANILPFLRLNRICREAGETLHYLIEAEGKRIFLLGSSALAQGTDYPAGCDLLVLPYSGRSDILRTALEIVERLQPKAVLADHFDDTFPPVSSQEDPTAFRQELARLGIPVMIPVQKEPIIL